MSEKRGFFVIHRKSEDHFLWTERREFSRWEAWEDLIREAAWRDHHVMIGGVLVHVRRGEVVHSERVLASRWGWSKTKTHRFLGVLKTEAMTDRRTDHGVNLLVLVNYDRYQRIDDESGPATNRESDQQRTSNGPATDQTEPRKPRNPPSPTPPATVEEVSGETGMEGGTDGFQERGMEDSRDRLTSEQWREIVRLWPSVGLRGGRRGVEDLLYNHNGHGAAAVAILVEAASDPRVKVPLKVVPSRLASGQVDPRTLAEINRILKPPPPEAVYDGACWRCGQRVRSRTVSGRGRVWGPCPSCEADRVELIEQ